MKKYIFLLLCTAISFAQASNQMVSFTQAQTLGFALKSGQVSVNSTQCMTKLDAFTKYNLATTANTNTLANNQLMRRDFWATAVVSYTNIYSEVTSTTAAGMCALMPASVFTSYKSTTGPVVNGSVLYTDSNLTAPIFGNGQFYGIDTNIGRISNGGVVSEYQSCAPPPPSYYTHQLSDLQHIDPSIPCGFSLSIIVYSNSNSSYPTVNTILYTNTALTTRFVGTSSKFRLCSSGDSLKIDSQGVILQTSACGF
jgi:hypothetical protein